METKIYCYKTLEECEKEIVDKAIILDITSVTNRSLFECFVRTIRTIMIWVMIITPIAVRYFIDFTTALRVFLLLLIIYSVGKLLMSWVKFNYNREINIMKTNLIKNMLESCKEWHEIEPDWHKKQIVKRVVYLANFVHETD